MQRFVVRQNIERFRDRLKIEADPGLRLWLQEMLVSSERELALFDSNSSGVRVGLRPASNSYTTADRQLITKISEENYLASPHPALILDPRAGLKIIDINLACERIMAMEPTKMIGRSLFDLFPDNPACHLSSGIAALYESLCRVAQTCNQDFPPSQRYDICGCDGHFLERYWRFSNFPIYDPQGYLTYLVTEWQS